MMNIPTDSDLARNNAARALPAKRGRPKKGEQGQVTARVLDSATRLFLEAGFAETSMDQVAAEAGCSKRTLYDRFPSKADLFKAVILRFSSERLALIEISSRSAGSTRERLLAAGAKLLEIALSDQALRLHRLLYQEIYKHHELTMIVDAVVREPPNQLIIRILRKDPSLDLRNDKLEFFAEHFVTLVVTAPMKQAMSAPRPVEVSREMLERLSLTVDFFMRGCGLDPISASANKVV